MPPVRTVRGQVDAVSVLGQFLGGGVASVRFTCSEEEGKRGEIEGGQRWTFVGQVNDSE